MRLQTVKLVLKGDKSAAKFAKELGINQNTVSRWVREYRKQNNLPTYEGERRTRKASVEELAPKRAFSQEDVHSFGNTAMFLLSVVKTGRQTQRTKNS